MGDAQPALKTKYNHHKTINKAWHSTIPAPFSVGLDSSCGDLALWKLRKVTNLEGEIKNHKKSSEHAAVRDRATQPASSIDAGQEGALHCRESGGRQGIDAHSFLS